MAGRNSPDADARTNLFAACRVCHDEIVPRLSMGAQVGVKRQFDPGGWDEDLFRSIWSWKNGRQFLGAGFHQE